MKRHWEIRKYNHERTLSFGVSLSLPYEEDYYDSQYEFRLEIFGYAFVIITWKE